MEFLRSFLTETSFRGEIVGCFLRLLLSNKAVVEVNAVFCLFVLSA